MKIESKPLLILLKTFTEDGLAKLEEARDSLFEVDDPEEQLKDINTKISSTEEILDAINRDLSNKH